MPLQWSMYQGGAGIEFFYRDKFEDEEFWTEEDFQRALAVLRQPTAAPLEEMDFYDCLMLERHLRSLLETAKNLHKLCKLNFWHLAKENYHVIVEVFEEESLELLHIVPQGDNDFDIDILAGLFKIAPEFWTVGLIDLTTTKWQDEAGFQRVNGRVSYFRGCHPDVAQAIITADMHDSLQIRFSDPPNENRFHVVESLLRGSTKLEKIVLEWYAGLTFQGSRPPTIDIPPFVVQALKTNTNLKELVFNYNHGGNQLHMPLSRETQMQIDYCMKRNICLGRVKLKTLQAKKEDAAKVAPLQVGDPVLTKDWFAELDYLKQYSPPDKKQPDPTVPAIYEIVRYHFVNYIKGSSTPHQIIAKLRAENLELKEKLCVTNQALQRLSREAKEAAAATWSHAGDGKNSHWY